MKIKKVCSWLLVLVLIVSMFSGTVFADESEISADTQISEDEISADRQVSEDETEKIEADDLYVNEIYEDTDILLDEEPVEEDAPEDVTEEPEPEYNAPEVPEGESHSIFDMLFDAVNGTNDVIYAGRESQLTPEIAAGGTDESYVTTGTYHYTSNEDSNIQESDTFVFREDCFMRSSYSGCDHLLLLSAQASIASASRYGAEPDLYEKDPSDNGYNIKNMLKDMGFKDVETNKYYTVEKLENSAAVAVGHRKISAYGKDYTLLAIIPRSAGYKQEWTGNFTVDTGYTHAGFKAGRDEILRFVKQYINQHKISGNLKVWITGHSRGSALSNLLGGFFAGGGIQYFGDSVTITPEDVYCFAFATPTTIREGLSLAEALSVEGYRGGVYEDDTPGEPFISKAAGTVDPLDGIYGGIRNYPLDYDFISYLPMAEWGFTHYGSILDITEGLSADTMIEEMASINSFVYNKLKNGGDGREFKEKTFDPASLSLIDKEGGKSGTEGLAAHARRLVAGLLYSSGGTTQEYVDSGEQETLEAAAGVFGTLFCVLSEELPKHSSELITPALLGYLAYASKLLQEEGRATNDAEAVTIAVDEMIRFVTGQGPETASINSHLMTMFKYFTDHTDSELVKKLNTLINDLVPEMAAGMIKGTLEKYHTDPDKATLGEIILAFMKAAVYGADPDSAAYKEYGEDTPEKVRAAFYEMLNAVLGLLKSFMGIDIDPKVLGENGSGSFTGLVDAILPLIMNEKDEDGNVINKFTNLADTADAAFVKTIDKIMKDVYVVVDEQYTPAFKEMVRHQVEGVKKNITKGRETLFNVLLYTGSSFNTEANICNICSLVGNAKMIETAHYNETYVAWAKTAVLAGRETGSHYISHVGYEESPESPDEHYEYWLCHDGNGEKQYKDRGLSEEGVLMHTWGEPTYELSDDYGTMTATRVCKNNPEHKQTETAETSGKVTTPATCTEKGRTTYTAVFKASCFGTGEMTVENIPAKGHTYKTTETAATTTRNGSIVSTCEVCGHVETTVIPAIKKISLSKTSFAYNGSIQKPDVSVKDADGKTLKKDTDYTVKYRQLKSRLVGIYAVTVTFMNHYAGTKTLKYMIIRAKNKIRIKPTTKTIRYSKLRNKEQTFTLNASVKEKAETTFSAVAVSKKARGYISVSKDGKVTVKKGLKKGIYTLKVKVTAKQTANFKKTSVTKKIRIIVK